MMFMNRNGMNPTRSRRIRNIGQAAETAVKNKYKRNGYKITEKGSRLGSDFKATKGKKSILVEVKTGTSKLRPKQAYYKATGKLKVHRVKKRKDGKFDLSDVRC